MRPRGSRRWLLLGGLVLALAVATAGTASSSRQRGALPSGPASGLPYLLYVSDLDGDNEVYGVRADGMRTVQITRDKAGFEDYGVVVSDGGRWAYVPRQLEPPYKQPASVVSTSGRVRRALAVHFVSTVAFSEGGRLFAYGQDAEWADMQHRAPHLMLLSPASGRSRRLGQGDPWSFSPDGSKLVALVTQFDRNHDDLNLIDVATGRVRRIAAVPSEGVGGFGWSPKGTRYAFVQGTALRVAEVARKAVRARTVLQDPRLKRLPTVRWLDERRLGLELDSDKSSLSEIDVVTVGASPRKTVVARASKYSPIWSPDGKRVAYTVQRGKEAFDLVVQASGGSPRRVVAHAAEMSLSWSPDNRLFVEYRNGSHSAVALVDPGHGLTDLSPGGDSVSIGLWSPDGRFVTLSYADQGALAVLALSPRARVVHASIGGNVRLLGWVRADAGPAAAKAPPAAPALERATGSRVLAEGKIAELSASGRTVAAIVGESAHDCHHVVAWTVGTAQVIRFDKPRRCGPDGENGRGDEAVVAVHLEGTRVTWIGESWGNSSYWTYYAADLRRPNAVRSTGDESGEHGEEPGRPPPEQATRRGVTARVESGTVVLIRASDGRTRRIHPTGGAVDAELENAGLFYAYDVKGQAKGNVVFVPFAKLFA